MVFDMLRGQIVETVTKLYDYVEDLPWAQDLIQFSTNTHVYTFRAEYGGKAGMWAIEGQEDLCWVPIIQIEEQQHSGTLNNEVLGPRGYDICEYSLTTASGTCSIKVHAEEGAYRAEEGTYPEMKLCKESWLTYAKDEKPLGSGLKRSVLHATRKWEQLCNASREKSPY